MNQLADALDDAYRREWAFVLAATVRVAGSIDVAEECVQDAFVAAIGAWGERGIPDNPAAWLTTAARRRALDHLRRDKILRSKLPLLIEPEAGEPDPGDLVVTDDRLQLVFTCCHPSLSPETQAALTLRLVCGLSTPRIARAFLVPEATMAARITRGKKKIEVARIPYAIPAESELPERLDTVLTVIHLFFTAGHTASSGDELVDAEVVSRSIDLARMLHQLLPHEPEVQGLLALMLLTDVRRVTRVDSEGRLVLLKDQDRSQWDAGQIDEGRSLVTLALMHRPPERFALQAAIAAVHAEAPSYEQTEWAELLGLYDVLLTVWSSPVVELNRAVVIAELNGPEAGLMIVEDIAADAKLNRYAYLPATRADLLRRMNRRTEAARFYEQAIALVDNEIERAFLQNRLAEVQV